MRKLALATIPVAFLFTATASLAADPVASCQARKLKAWAKLRSCEHKASAKVVTGGTVDPTTCKTKFDAALAKAGTGCRYLSMETGTVTDLDTGLMWQKTDDNGGITDKDWVWDWSCSIGGSVFCGDETIPVGTAFTWFLAELNDCTSVAGTSVSGGFAGHCDWRLPEVDELRAIVDCSFGEPCIDQTAFGPTEDSAYWSATSVADDALYAWWVGFTTGYVGKSNKWQKWSVRAVRSGL